MDLEEILNSETPLGVQGSQAPAHPSTTLKIRVPMSYTYLKSLSADMNSK